jgi:hypothetical protein
MSVEDELAFELLAKIVCVHPARIDGTWEHLIEKVRQMRGEEKFYFRSAASTNEIWSRYHTAHAHWSAKNRRLAEKLQKAREEIKRLFAIIVDIESDIAQTKGVAELTQQNKKPDPFDSCHFTPHNGNLILVTDECTWTQDPDDGSYDTECGNLFEIMNGTPSENGMKFCPYCGDHIVDANKKPDPP